MSTMDLRLSAELDAYLREESARRGYTDAGEFVRSLVEAERHRQIKREVEQLLLETVNGPFTDWTDADVDDIRTAGRRAVERRNAR
jgi:hypothetical protein